MLQDQLMTQAGFEDVATPPWLRRGDAAEDEASLPWKDACPPVQQDLQWRVRSQAGMQQCDAEKVSAEGVSFGRV